MESFVRVLAFAGAREVVGEPEIRVALGSACTAGELFEEIVRAYPGLGPYRACIRLAINGVYASETDEVAVGDEVALIPPVAGG